MCIIAQPTRQKYRQIKWKFTQLHLTLIIMGGSRYELVLKKVANYFILYIHISWLMGHINIYTYIIYVYPKNCNFQLMDSLSSNYETILMDLLKISMERFRKDSVIEFLCLCGTGPYACKKIVCILITRPSGRLVDPDPQSLKSYSTKFLYMD